MLTKTFIALSLLTGTVALTSCSQVSDRNPINPVSSQTVTQLSTTELENIARNITVRINGENSGSGILIAKDYESYNIRSSIGTVYIYTIITNARVTDREGVYSIQTPDGMEHEAILSGYFSTEESDLAVLRFDSSNDYQTATIGNSDNITKGETVVAAGFPHSEEELVVTEGKISLITEKPLNKGYSIGFSQETVRGMSGGALLNLSGEVIAVLGKGKNGILNTAYDYMNGTSPTRDEIATYKKVSFSIPIANIGTLSHSLGALLPNESNPELAQQPKVKTETPAHKPEYTGIVKKFDDIAEQITVRIATPEIPSYGSGVIIARDNNTYYVATAKHVVKDRKNYQIVTPDGRKYKLNNQTIEESDAYDLAIFSFKSGKDYTVATIGNYVMSPITNDMILEEHKHIFRTVFVSGFPQNQSPQRTITGGVKVLQDSNFTSKDSYSLDQIGQGLLYTNLSYKGMSGGAVLDREGRLIGINTGAENELHFDREGDNNELSLGYSLGVPIQDILSFLTKETKLNIEWLQTNNEPLWISDFEVSDTYKEFEEIRTQLFNVERPEDETDLIAWMNYGNQLWRYRKSDAAINAFNRVLELDPEFYQAHYAIGLAYWSKHGYYNYLGTSLLSVGARNLEKAIQISSNPPYFYYRRLGLFYRSMGRLEEALVAYDKAIAKNSQDFVLYVEQGDILREIGRYDEAVIFYNEADKLNPNHFWIYLNRSIAYEKQGKTKLALADFNKAVQLSPYYSKDDKENFKDREEFPNVRPALVDDIPLIIPESGSEAVNNDRGETHYILGKYHEAIADFNVAISINDKFPKAYKNRGDSYRQLKQYDKAFADYNKAISLNPKYSEAYESRAKLYEKLEQYDKALADYTQAITLKPENIEAFKTHVFIYYVNEERYDKAIALYNQIIALAPKDADSYYSRAKLYEKLEQYDKAIADFTQAITLEPENIEAYNSRAKLYEKLEQYDKAIADYTQIIAIEPENTSAYSSRARLYEKLKQYDKAIADYTQIIAIEPKNTFTYRNRALLYNIELEQYDKALADYNQIIALEPEDIFAYRIRAKLHYKLKQYDKALADYNEAIIINPKDVKTYERRAYIYLYKLKQYDKALADYNQIIALEPENISAYSDRAFIYQYELEQYDKALADYDKAISLDPKNVELYNSRAEFHEKLEQYDKAIADYTQIIALDSKNTKAYNNRARLHERLEQYDKAIADYTQTIAIEPQNTSAFSGRGGVYHKLEQHDKALADYSKAISISSDKFYIHYQDRGDLYRDLEQYDKALADYTKAIALESQDTYLYELRAFTYAKLKQYDKAIADYTQIIALKPKSPSAYAHRGRLYRKLEKYDAALKDINKAIAADPEHGLTYNRRANLYRELKQYDKALADYDKAISIAPDSAFYAPVYQNRGDLHKELGNISQAEQDWKRANDFFEEKGGIEELNKIRESLLLQLPYDF